MKNKKQRQNSTIDLNKAIAFVKTTVIEAGEILETYFSSKNSSSKEKPGVDFTTQADLKADKFLQNKLKAKYPFSNFLTEETAPLNYSSFIRKENLWVIDPLDGTINFSRKDPNFCISVALLSQGQIQLGVIYLPISKKLYWAQKNKKTAYLNAKKISASTTSDLKKALLACDWSWDLEKRKELVKWFNKLNGHARYIKVIGTAAIALAALAEGKIDCYLHSGTKLWDVAASVLIIRKAGGLISLPNGDNWSPFNNEIFAANKKVYRKILKLIN